MFTTAQDTVQPILDFISCAGLEQKVGRDSDSLKAPSLGAAVLYMNTIYALPEAVGS